jgi:hypothetical protein
MNIRLLCVILGFLREVGEIFALLGYYEAYGGNFLQTFRDVDPENSVGNYHYTLRNNSDSEEFFVSCICCQLCG